MEEFFKELKALCKKHNVLIYSENEDLESSPIIFDFHCGIRYVHIGDEIDFNKKYNMFECLQETEQNIII